MLRCQNCGTALPENARFCAQCGHALRVMMDTPTYSSNLMNYQGMMQPSTGRSGKEEDEEEQRRSMLLGWPLRDGMIGDAQPSAGNVPLVQGSPSTSGVPMWQGTPSIGGPSSAPSASSAAFNPPATPGLYHTGTSSQGVQQLPVSH